MGILINSLILIPITYLLYLISKLINARSFFRELKARGLPMPPHPYVLGHLLHLDSMRSHYPSDALKTFHFGHVAKEHAPNGAVYLDLYPFADPFLVITSPYLAEQVTHSTNAVSYSKPRQLRSWFWSLTGGENMFSTEVEQWKVLRGYFARGFSSAFLGGLVDGITEEVEIYCEGLRKKAKAGKIFGLDDTNLRFMIDIIGRTALNTQLHAQTGYNALADTMLDQVKRKLTNQEVNLLQWFNVIRPTMEWLNGRKMDAYINNELDKRFEAYKSLKSEKHTYDSNGSTKPSQSIIDLALEDYMSDPSNKGITALTPEFRTMATQNIRLLLYVGHDSTGSTISWTYHLLSKNPDALTKLLQEHDSVFGSDIKFSLSIIRQNPNLINQLPYTTAVIKESLRLFPPAGCIRQGKPGHFITDEQGNSYPTDKCMLYVLHYTIQRDPAYWVRPQEFLPERWIAQPGDELYPDVKGAWRPFETGPRNCIGQALVMMELKIILVAVMREFEVNNAYEEWDASDEGKAKKGMKEIDGERAYQVDSGSAHPADGFPCRVTLRKRNGMGY